MDAVPVFKDSQVAGNLARSPTHFPDEHFLYEKITETGYDGVERWAKGIGSGLGLLDLDVLLVPVHIRHDEDPRQNHSILLV